VTTTVSRETAAFAGALDVIAQVEPRVAAAIGQELTDQRESLKLIASENYASPAVLLAMGNWFSDKYAEGTPGRRFYAACQNVDTVERLADLPLTLRSDPHAPGLETAPFQVVGGSSGSASVFDNGMPTPAVDWISGGVLTNLIRPRAWALKTTAPATAALDNLILEDPNATASPAEMIARTERGLLLTTLWYIREVDPQTLLVTGLTRDGVFLVEGGEVTGAVNNFRFNESPVDLLGRTVEASRTERTLPREWNDWFTRAAMPMLRVPDFNMSSVSPAS
jgi:predicted Zn-dependent protease